MLRKYQVTRGVQSVGKRGFDLLHPFHSASGDDSSDLQTETLLSQDICYRLVQRVHCCGDAGLLWQIWQSDWNFSQDSPRKSGAPAASRSRAEFIVATVEIVKQIIRIENSSPFFDECNGLVGADWGIDQRGSSSRFPLSG